MSLERDELYTEEQLSTQFDSHELAMEAFGCLQSSKVYMGYGPNYPQVPPSFRMPNSFLRVGKLSELLRLAKDANYAYTHILTWYSSCIHHNCIYPLHQPDHMGLLKFSAEPPHVTEGHEVPQYVVNNFPHLRAYHVRGGEPCIRLTPPSEGQTSADLATIASFLHLSQDPELTILKSKLAQDISLETLSLSSAVGDEARRNFLLKDMPGGGTSTPPTARPMGAISPPARPATPTGEGMGLDAHVQPLSHGLELAGHRFSTGLGTQLEVHAPPTPKPNPSVKPVPPPKAISDPWSAFDFLDPQVKVAPTQEACSGKGSIFGAEPVPSGVPGTCVHGSMPGPYSRFTVSPPFSATVPHPPAISAGSCSDGSSTCASV